jgi:alkyldihydroxyacetonephosphate synthase
VRRWNGWGDESVRVEVPQGALEYLRERIGPGDPPPDASFDAVVAAVPASRLPQHPLIDITPSVRVLHARGQSLPDWLALRFGVLGRVPDGVAFPESSEDVRELLGFARASGARLIPYGGGTSVVGHLDVPDGEAPVLTVSLARLRALLDIDRTSCLATFAAGVAGPDLEAQLRPHGYTLGHFPQSFEYSTLGGWIVTRSSGQQSLHYGRIEGLFAGARVETPVGTLSIPTVPASAAGIDIREMVMGSEGRIGFVTEATVRVRELPEHESFHGIFFPDWARAEHAVRTMAQAGLALSMLRLSNPMETFTTLKLAGDGSSIRMLERYLALRGVRDEKCLLMAGVTGDNASCATALRAARAIASRHGGVYIGRRLGDRWEHNRFKGVYFRNAMWEHGYAIDTAETAVDWPRVGSMVRDIEAAARTAFGDVPVHAYTHLSHVYAEGSSVYSTFIFPIAPTLEENMERWTRFKRAICEAILANGGTISHQHGVGVDHKPYLVAEKGELGIDAMRAIFARFDPSGTMNPGKLC